MNAVVEHRRGAASLSVEADWAEALIEAGFDRAERWQRELDGGEQDSGRGATAVVRLPGRAPLRLKQLRRGGLVGPLWRDRYPGRGRPRANFLVPRLAIERGVPTPAPVALLMLQGPPGLFRAWLALCEVEPARDLMQRLRAGEEPDWVALGVAWKALFEAGIEHPDLNLGNLLLDGEGRGWILDLDKARLHSGPLAPNLRERAFARMERSYAKTISADPDAVARFGRRIRDA